MPATLTTLKDVALEPGEAVAVIRALARRFPLAFDPKTDVQRSDAVIRAARLTCLALSADGEVLWESSEPLTGVHEAATLLDALLASAARTPGPLRYIVARGLRTVDAPGFPSLAAFSEALARFAPPDEGA